MLHHAPTNVPSQFLLLDKCQIFSLDKGQMILFISGGAQVPNGLCHMCQCVNTALSCNSPRCAISIVTIIVRF